MTRFTLSSLSLLAVLMAGCFVPQGMRPLGESATTGEDSDPTATEPTGDVPTTDPNPTTDVDPYPTTGELPTTGVDTDSDPTTGQETDTGLTSTTDTGEECPVINCSNLPLTDEGQPYGRPTCDDGLQASELIESMIAYYQVKHPWFTACFDGDPSDLKAVASWLNLMPEVNDTDPATSCMLDDLSLYDGGPILALKPMPDGNYGLGETEKVVSEFCFSGAHAEDDQRHLAQLAVLNTPMALAELSPGITVRLQCGGSEFPVLLEGGQGLIPVDCSTVNGVAGSLHLEVDIAEQGGQVGDQFRLGIYGGLTSGDVSVHILGQKIAPLWTLQ